MRKTKEWIIQNKGIEYYEAKKKYQREYEKAHREERNAYKNRRRWEKNRKQYEEIETLEGEIWKDVVGYEEYYKISNKGRCISLDYNGTKVPRLMKPSKASNRGEYMRYCLSMDGVKKDYKIHRLVAEAFIPNPNNLPMVNHKDENPKNNCVENLEWCDAKYNCNYGTAIERKAEHKKRPVLAYHNEDDCYKIWFSSSADAAEILSGNRRNGTFITAVIHNRMKSYKGLKWKYVA